MEIFNNSDIDIDIYLKKLRYIYNFIEHYSTLYNFNVILINNNFSKNIIDEYDKIFKLSSNDYCLDHKTIISILHLNGVVQLKCKSEKNVKFNTIYTRR